VVALAHADCGRGLWVRRKALSRTQAGLATFFLVSAIAGCTVGPDYSPPAAPTPTTYKELKGWKVATPADGPGRGEWWAFYRDPKLSLLIKQVEVSNQTVAGMAAAYEQARAVIREAQSSLYPVITGSYAASRSYTGPGSGGITSTTTTTSTATGLSGITASRGGGVYASSYVPQLSGSWDLDVWGKIRRQIESNASAAQASKANLDYAKLSAQAMLATAYFNLRATDSLHDLLARTVREDQKTLNIVRNQYNAGYSVTAGDVATAEANLLITRAQEIQVGVQRAQYEHAIAMLIGRPPAELTVAQHPLSGTIPKIPVAVPSTLLERRPDIAAAERTMQEQNALIGVAVAGYFPDISLSALLGWSSGVNPLPFNVANVFWSLGANATETLFNGGLTSAEVDAARAVYWQSVANYRQTVLTAFQGVEDELVAIRLLKEALAVQEKAVKDARQAVDVYLNQFQAGTVAFTTVVTAEITLLADEETELTLRQDLFLASVTLIEDLGGGWDSNLLPTRQELEKDFSLLPQLPPNEPWLRFEPFASPTTH
jgi:NodT family efflux transporter outer membrane factor (OMF) lipoprotein